MSKLSHGENEEKQGKIMTNLKTRLSSGLLCIAAFLMVVTVLFLPVNAAENTDKDREYIVGGDLFGISMQTDGVLVVGLDKVETAEGTRCPAYDAGIKLRDIITEINGQKISSAEKVLQITEGTSSEGLNIKVRRGKTEKIFKVLPALGKDGKFHMGVIVRDSAAGIGTITYIDPVTGEFGGLGHGICDGNTGALMPISRGTVTDVKLSGIVKGQSGIPGEIKGVFGIKKQGALVKNKDTGVYGVLTNIPKELGQKLKTADIDEVQTGNATIRCNVSGKISDYQINITKVTKNVSGGKNFSIEVTDEKLLAITGGIVQGMSGSPIIQNGKLIGAVTHVTVGNPKTGYGIAIRNMITQQ